MEKIIIEIVEWMKNFLEISKKKGFVLGVSGGIDSAVLAVILNQYFPNQSALFWIDVNSSKDDYEYACLLKKEHNLSINEINLNKSLIQLKKDLNLKAECEGNVKSRLRMLTLYAKAQELDYLVLGTTNLIEFQIGYFTKFGDECADLAPLKDLLKSQIYAIAKVLKIPDAIIKREPSAGLYDGQTDEEEIGIKYKDLDLYFSNGQVSELVEKKILNKIAIAKHKREKVPYPKIKK
ncbi:MAG: NAD(+) synthase [Mycoplasmoidaceae bacterium]